VAQQQWVLIQPAGTLATGTVTLPLNTGTPDGTEVLVTTTQQITTLTIGLNGAAAVYGNGLTTMSAGDQFSSRLHPTPRRRRTPSGASPSAPGWAACPAR
jgi:hypothetical protein